MGGRVRRWHHDGGGHWTPMESSRAGMQGGVAVTAVGLGSTGGPHPAQAVARQQTGTRTNARTTCAGRCGCTHLTSSWVRMLR